MDHRALTKLIKLVLVVIMYPQVIILEGKHREKNNIRSSSTSLRHTVIRVRMKGKSKRTYSSR
jgi:hypothetical protein